jgi:uncharacterized RDD family membrane protein YckC
MTATQQPDPFGAAPARIKGPRGPRAGFWRRFAASFLDGMLLGVIYVPLAVIASRGAGWMVYLLISGTYFTLLEGGPRGQTLGKMALGIRVIDFPRDGPIGYERALIRYLGRIVSLIPLYLGYLWMLWDTEKQTWHDKMAGAVVVPTSSYPID